jgi:hypothetical protein|tara:strand:+ start:252 stop:569 length:318 start_codon:yes stop_codon:yes gene_type:complete
MIQELTLGQYHYWNEDTGDNIKKFHFFEDNNGNDVHIDFSPYYTVTEHDQDAVREFVEMTGRIPTREDNNGINFHKGDIFKILKDICPCGDPACEEKYEHTTSGW